MPVVILDIVESGFDIFDICVRGSTCFLLKIQSFTARCRFGSGRAFISGGSDMFRISTIDTQRERRLVVEGTLVQPWVAELRRTWSDAGASLNGRTIVIDLSNATTIDAEGEKVISDLIKEGAKFCCSGVLTTHVLKQLAHRCNTRLRNVLKQRRSNGGKRPEREEQ